MNLGGGALTVTIQVDPLTNTPDTLWEHYQEQQGRVCKEISPLVDPKSPKPANCVRFVCIADTHGHLKEILSKIPDGDVLIHAGDWTNFGDTAEIEKFNKHIGRLPHPHKIVIAGNHELGFDDEEDCTKRLPELQNHGTPKGYQLLTNCTYLQDNSVEIEGITVYGSSWHPLHGYTFGCNRGEDLLEKWNRIPTGVDVLITHTPPLGHGDLFKGNERWGCAELLNTVEQRVQPAFHVFGHVHEQNGLTMDGGGKTVYINASICNMDMKPVNEAIVFDFPKKK